MKVLITGRAITTQPDRCTSQQLADGFRQAGHEAVFYGNFYGEPYRWLGADEAVNEKFDLVIIGEMNDGYPVYPLNTLNLKDTPRLYWDFDVSYHPNPSYARAQASQADGFLVGNRYYCGTDAFGRFGKPVLHLPYACSPQIHRTLDVPKRYTIGFIGSTTPERARLIELCKKTAHRRSDVFAGEGIFGDDLIRHTNSFHIMFHNNQEACKGLVPGRPWETAGCGTALLMDRTSFEDFAPFIPEARRDAILVYNDDNDILAAIDKQQKRLNLLQLEAGALQEHVHVNHSYKNRAEEIVEWLKTW
jgi:hypothetical protein